MIYTQHYESPLGGILLAADETGLTGLWFDGEKYYADNLAAEHEARDTQALGAAKRWLDVYFAGKEPIPAGFMFHAFSRMASPL